MWISYYRVSLNFQGEGDRTPQDPQIGLLDFWNSELLYQKILKLKIIVISGNLTFTKNFKKYMFPF